MIKHLGLLWNCYVAPGMILCTDQYDPMSIIRKEDGAATTKSVERYYGASQLFEILRTGFLVVCICATLISLIALLFVNKSEMIADKKADVMHKLLIAFLISSFVSILGIIAQFAHVIF